MATLNYLCTYDDSDEDCYKCAKHGYMFQCPANCPDFDDGRKYLSKEMLEERERLMAKLGVKDKIKVGEPWKN